jgi:hypothetical protein
MTALTDAIVTAYEMTDADIAALEFAIFEQLRMAWIEQIRNLATQHGAPNAIPMLQGAELARIQQKAHDDAVSIAATYNRELRSQVEAIYRRNPTADRSVYVEVLNSWGRERGERKTLTIAIGVILWAAQYGLTVFITRNNLESQLFKAVHGTPVCVICIRIVAAGVVSYQFTQDNELPAHPNCYGEYVVVNATDLGSLGLPVWAGAA